MPIEAYFMAMSKLMRLLLAGFALASEGEAPRGNNSLSLQLNARGKNVSEEPEFRESLTPLRTVWKHLSLPILPRVLQSTQMGGRDTILSEVLGINICRANQQP